MKAHRSTIVFVNNRRLAERLALRLNELAEEEIARAHHGSIAREQRLEIEELLKRGEIPCLVATSSLELGIDMGAVELVIQVESPKSVARGLQRVGRAGHSLGEVSRGRIFPKFRADLLESGRGRAQDARGRDRGDVDPAQPARRARAADRRDLRRRGDRRRRAPRPGQARVSVRRALARPARERARHARRPLPVGRVRRAAAPDRLGPHGRRRSAAARARAGSPSRTRARSRTAASSASTSSTAAAAWASWTRRWSTRPARARRSCSAPRRGGSRRSRATACSCRRRPGVPGAVPFWKGEGVGRPYELGAAIGQASRELVALPEEKAKARLGEEFLLDERAAANLLTFLREQEAATGAVPSDKTIVVERFRDEIGDWRVCILTPFGGRVHAPWAMAIARRLRESLGLEVQSLWSDDGIALHLPDADATPALEEILVDPNEVEELVVAEVGDTALFGARFRENAARALLIPRRRPGERTPLWQQRLKAQGLLQVARKYGSFPIILETYRECLQDVFDLPVAEAAAGGAALARDRLRRRRDRLVLALLGLAALRLRRDVHVRGRHASRGAAGAGARARPRPPARAARPGGAARPARRRRRRRGRALARRRSAQPRRAPRRAPPPRRLARGRVRRGPGGRARSRAPRAAGPDRRRRAADRGRGRRPLPRRARRMPPGGLPEAFLEGGAESLRELVQRYAKGRGPFTTARGERPLRPATSSRSCASSSARSCSSAASCGRAEPSASGATRTCSAACAARPWPRCAARSSRSSRRRWGASCRAGTGSTGGRRCARRSCRSRGCRCRSRCGRRRCCRGGCPTTRPPSSTSCARRARSSGWEPASTASRSTSARTRPRSAARAGAEPPEGELAGPPS